MNMASKAFRTRVTGFVLLTSVYAAALAANPRTAGVPIDCDQVLKKPMGQQTQAEYDACTKPALQKALCDAVEEAARTNGCGRRGTEDPRCMQLSRVLMTCLRDGNGLPAATGPRAASR
jgi:hypothetical protein